MAQAVGRCSRAPVYGHATLAVAAQCPECGPKMRAAVGLPAMSAPVLARIQVESERSSRAREIASGTNVEEIVALIDIANARGGLRGDLKDTLSEAAKNPLTPTAVLVEILELCEGTDSVTAREVFRDVVSNPSLPVDRVRECLHDPSTGLNAVLSTIAHPEIDPADWARTILDRPDSDASLGNLAKRPRTPDFALDEVSVRALDVVAKTSSDRPLDAIMALCEREHLPSVAFDRLADAARSIANGTAESFGGDSFNRLAMLTAIASSRHASDGLIEDLAPYIGDFRNGTGLGSTADKRLVEECLRRPDLSSTAVSALINRVSRLVTHPNTPGAILEERVRRSSPDTAILRHPNLTDEGFRIAMTSALRSGDSDRLAALASNPSLGPWRAREVLEGTKSPIVRAAIARRSDLPQDLVTVLARSRDEATVTALIKNDVTPIETVGRLASRSGATPAMNEAIASRAQRHIVSLGFPPENHGAHDYLAQGEWWRLSQQSREVAIAQTVHANP